MRNCLQVPTLYQGFWGKANNLGVEDQSMEKVVHRYATHCLGLRALGYGVQPGEGLWAPDYEGALLPWGMGLGVRHLALGYGP